ncbi:WAT1-related protein [Quillaja saponaria]|uniref:WAT1-related protein n=1 Tax=Quillaja saponaria TaxID=32244 RepID=A0AAD7PUT1_QUISA|nr:WAT1-related protein [Quillaja saponaria]
MLACDEWKPFVAMVAIDFAFAIVNILLKKVLDEGLNHLVLITYRLSISTIFLAPIGYFWERGWLDQACALWGCHGVSRKGVLSLLQHSVLLLQIMAAVIDIPILHEQLHLGSVLGSILANDWIVHSSVG